MGIFLDVDRWLFGFQEEFAGAADTKTIIRGFCDTSDFDGIFVNDLFLGFGVALFIGYIPAQLFHQRVDVFKAHLGFVILSLFIGFEVVIESVCQFQYPVRYGHVNLKDQV